MRRTVAVLCFFKVFEATVASSVAGSAHAAQTPTSSPVTRIVELLKGLQEVCEADAKSDETLYEKFVCWGRQVIKQKEATNAIAGKEVSELTQYVEDLDSGRIELTSERVDLEKEVADLSSSIELAEAQRSKEKADFENAEAEMTQAIEALSKAAEVLKEATDGHKTGVLAEVKAQVGHRAEAEAKEAAVLKRAAELGDRFLAKGDAVFLRRLLTGEVPTWDWKKLNRKATFKMSYKARSFGIQDVISKLLETFQTNLKDATDKEKTAEELFTKQLESLNSQRDMARDALTKMATENGEKSLSKTEAQDRIDLLTDQIANDEKYIKQVREELASKKAEWEERSRIRYGEISAMSKAIEILHNDDSRDNFKKSFASQGYFFLQTGQHSTLRDAADVLRSIARKTSDKRVLALVEQMQLAPAFASLADRFKPIIEKIDSLVIMLEEEEASDTEKKETCEKSRAENTRAAIKSSREIDDDTDKISTLTSDIEQLEQQIKENKDAMMLLNKQMEEAAVQRAAEKKAYEADERDDEEAAKTVQSAHDVLETFYTEEGLMAKSALLQRRAQAPVVVAAGKAPPPPPTTWDSPYSGKTAESTGILAILSMIKEDIERDISKAKSTEEDAVKTFTSLNKVLKAEYASRQEDETDMESQVAANEGKRTETKEARGLKKGELDVLLSGIADMEPGCNFFTVNFPLRVKNRQTETDGLLKAKAILQGADFDPKKELQFRQLEGHLAPARRHE